VKTSQKHFSQDAHLAFFIVFTFDTEPDEDIISPLESTIISESSRNANGIFFFQHLEEILMGSNKNPLRF